MITKNDDSVDLVECLGHLRDKKLSVQSVLTQIYPYSVNCTAIWPWDAPSVPLLNSAKTFDKIYQWCQDNFNPNTFAFYDNCMYFKHSNDMAYFMLKWAEHVNPTN